MPGMDGGEAEMARYEARATRSIGTDPEAARTLAGTVLGGLGGKVRASGVDGTLAANFNKKVGKRYLQNRVDVELLIEPDPDVPGSSRVHGVARPVDPLGRPLAFGVLGEPGAVVLGEVLDTLERAASSA